jgi:hypothetical protein
VKYDFANGPPVALLEAMEKVGLDEKLEAALAAKIDVLLHYQSGIVPDPVAAVLEKKGTARSLPALYRYLLADDGGLDTAGCFARCCRAIISRADAPDDELGLLPVEPEKLPPLAKVRHVLTLFGESKGRSVSRLVTLIDAVRGLAPAPNDPDWKKNRRESLRAGYESLARIGTSEAFEALLRYVDQDPEELAVLPVSACQSLPANAVTPEVLSRIVDLMEHRSPEDLAVFSATLSRLTGKTLGTNVGAWKSYARKLVQDASR